MIIYDQVGRYLVRGGGGPVKGLGARASAADVGAWRAALCVRKQRRGVQAQRSRRRRSAQEEPASQPASQASPEREGALAASTACLAAGLRTVWYMCHCCECRVHAAAATGRPGRRAPAPSRAERLLPGPAHTLHSAAGRQAGRRIPAAACACECSTCEIGAVHPVLLYCTAAAYLWGVEAMAPARVRIRPALPRAAAVVLAAALAHVVLLPAAHVAVL